MRADDIVRTPIDFDAVRFALNGEPVDEGWLQLQCNKWRHQPDYEKRLLQVTVSRRTGLG